MKWGDNYGRVTAVAGTTVTIQQISNVKVSGSAAMRTNVSGNIKEVLENVVAFGVIARVQGVDFFGAQTTSYMAASALYEFLLKDVMSPLADFLQSPAIPAGTEKSLIQGDDFRDVLRRAPMIFILQQVIQKYWHKKSLGAHWAQNLISGAGGNYVTNVMDRYLFAEDKKAYYYT